MAIVLKIFATSAEVTPNGGLAREFHQHALNSGLGIIGLCPDCSPDVGKYASHGSYGMAKVLLTKNTPHTQKILANISLWKYAQRSTHEKDLSLWWFYKWSNWCDNWLAYRHIHTIEHGPVLTPHHGTTCLLHNVGFWSYGHTVSLHCYCSCSCYCSS